MSVCFAGYAWLPDGLARDVSFEIENGRFTAVTAGASAPADARRIAGAVLPGFANAHSHAFHRALRGRTHSPAGDARTGGGRATDGGTFWTWRQRMYELARRLEPESYLALARATYAEMALAGVSAVGEFHYLHHDRDGRPYAEPNAMGDALRQAAAEAGIRLTLLDTCYLEGGLGPGGHTPMDPVQRRFADADVEAWGARIASLRDTDGVRIGAAIHSVRAVPRAALAAVRNAAGERPLHVHLSEQPAENEACRAYYGCSPTQLLAQENVLGPTLSAVHATHLDGEDITLLGEAGATACFCPTTERDLADGIGPARALRERGVALSLGSDQHAVIDMLEEARALEMHERLASLQRGRFQPPELIDALTGHASIGWPDAGRLEPGARADLVSVRLDTVRTAGVAPEQVLFAASAADIDTVIVDGQVVVEGGQHRLGDVAALLDDAISPLWAQSR